MFGFNSKRLLLIVIVIGLFGLFGSDVFADDWAKTNIKNLNRLDLRNLGYSQVNEIPVNSSAITSLLTSAEGKIYGVTSGDQSYLFLYDSTTNKVKHLGKIAGETGVHHSLVQDKDGYIYIGTGKSILEPVQLTIGGPGEKFTEEKTLWADIQNHFKDYSGGRLYCYDPANDNRRAKLVDSACDLEDLGVAVANNSIYALTISPAGDEIYGLSYPDGRFFVYNIESKSFKNIGPIDKKVVHHGPERDWRSLCRSLICDASTGGELKYYSPASGKIIATGQKIPGDYYHAQIYSDYDVVEYFAKDASGLIYGGTSDGYLFSYDPQNNKLLNHGKPRASRRLRALAIANDGKVYMIAGERSAAKPCQFYSYDPNAGAFEDLGILVVDRSPYYRWRGFQFDCMTTGLDGTIFLGESERKSHLFMYIP